MFKINTKRNLHIENMQKRKAKKSKDKAENNIEVNDDEYPKVYSVMLDGNQTEKGKILRNKLEKSGFKEENIEDEVQVQHALSLFLESNNSYRPDFDFRFNRIGMFVNELVNKGIKVSLILDYLKSLKKENLQRKDRSLTVHEIEKEKIPRDQIIYKKDVRLFDEKIDAEIKYMEENLKSNNVDQGTSAEEKLKFFDINESKNIVKKITWVGNKQDLIYLFENLEKLGFIEYDNDKNQLLDIHFNIYDKKTKKSKDLDPQKISDIRSKINTPNSIIRPKDSIIDIIYEFQEKKTKKN